MYNNLSQFSLKKIIRKLNSIFVKINFENSKPFPKVKGRLFSFYIHQEYFTRIKPNGYFNKPRLICSLIDFSFVRSLVADAFSVEGGHCYDPVSLFLCDLFRWLDNFHSMKEFCITLQDKNKGFHYRLYAGISPDNIPDESTFSEFRVHLGETRYNQIFHLLVRIIMQLEIITGKILSHDGTLVPTFARYHGCNYASSDCAKVPVCCKSGEPKDFLSHIRNRILHLLKNPLSIRPDKTFYALARCPKPVFPNGVKPHCIKIFEFKLLPFDQAQFDPNDLTPKLLCIEEQLKAANLRLVVFNSRISQLNLDFKDNPAFVCCPKIPADLDAKIGCRRDKDNPNKTEKVFGFNVIISTAVEPLLGTQFPVACITRPGSDKDGSFFIPLKEQFIAAHPSCHTFFDIGDAGFDFNDNYNFSRAKGSIPIFDYNPRNEKLAPQDILKRGYDEFGYPLAPCNIVCKSNGFDKKENRLSFVCAKQCLSKNCHIPNPIPDCKYLKLSLGFSCHKAISENPHLYCETPRNSDNWKAVRKLRSASERTNASTKADFVILDHPRTMGLVRFQILAQIACIVVLLKKFLHFIVNITLLIKKAFKDTSNKTWKLLDYKKVPAFILNVIQRK